MGSGVSPAGQPGNSVEHIKEEGAVGLNISWEAIPSVSAHQLHNQKASLGVKVQILVSENSWSALKCARHVVGACHHLQGSLKLQAGLIISGVLVQEVVTHATQSTGMRQGRCVNRQMDLEMGQ